HARPVGAGAGHLDLSRRRKQPVRLATNALHDMLRQLALQEFDKGADRAGAVGADCPPARRRCYGDVNLDLVDLGAADQRLDLAALDLEVDHRAVVDVGSPTRKAVGEVRIALKVVAPRLAPEAPDDLAALDDHRRDDAPFFCELPDFLRRLRAPCGNRHIRPETPVAHVGPPSWVAAAKSSLTRAISSASASSVRLISPPPVSRSSAILRLDSISSSIRSSIVPRQTNLCTRTLRLWPMRKARSVAWFSTAGFHQRSKCTTCEAAVRLRPEPPA